MNTYKVSIEIKAECPDDAEELILDYTGNETDVKILSVEEADNANGIELLR